MDPQSIDTNAFAPVLTVLGYASIAAAFAAFGVLPLIGRQKVSTILLGLANSLAAGLMLGAAYALMVIDPDGFAPVSAFAAIIGIGYVLFTHLVIGTTDLDLNRLDEEDPTYAYKVLLVNTLHGAAEGVAMGVAVDPPHANPVITSAAIREIKMRLFISFTGVLIGFPGKAQNNPRL